MVIHADDLGCYNPNIQIRIPHLDQLSREGIRFTDEHSGSAVCPPTRYGLLTGRYGFRSPLKQGVLGGYSPALIEQDRFTPADLIKQAGYQTGVIGNWHLGLIWPLQAEAQPQPVREAHQWPAGNNLDITANLTDGPNELGFDYSYIIPSSLDIPPYLNLENGKPTSRELINIEGNNEPRGVFWRDSKAGKDFKLKETLDHLAGKAQQF